MTPAAERTLTRLLRGSLWLLLVPAVPFSILALVAGTVSGFHLWRLDRPWLTVFWLALVLLPGWIVLALRRTKDSLPLLALACVAVWSLVGYYAHTVIR